MPRKYASQRVVEKVQGLQRVQKIPALVSQLATEAEGCERTALAWQHRLLQVDKRTSEAERGPCITSSSWG